MSISKKLKELIVAFGGADDPKKISGRQIDRLIGTLADAVEAGGGSGGGGGGLIVTLTPVAGSDTNFTADKSLSEIIAARNAGTPVWLGIDSAGLMLPISHVVDVDGIRMAFATVILDVNEGQFAALMLGCSDGDKAWEAISKEYRISASPVDIPFTLTVDQQGGFTATTNYTFAEIRALYYDHHPIQAKGALTGVGQLLLPLTTLGDDGLQFSAGLLFGSDYGIARITVSSNDVVTAVFKPLGA